MQIPMVKAEIARRFSEYLAEIRQNNAGRFLKETEHDSAPDPAQMYNNAGMLLPLNEWPASIRPVRGRR